MAFSCNISLKVNDNQLNTEKSFNPSELPFDYDYKEFENYALPKTLLDKPFINIYIQSYGNPIHIGEILLEQYNDYDNALNLICGGDIKIFGKNILTRYMEHGLSEWKDNKPITSDVPIHTENWSYLFLNNKWFVKNKNDINSYIELLSITDLNELKLKNKTIYANNF